MFYFSKMVDLSYFDFYRAYLLSVSIESIGKIIVLVDLLIINKGFEAYVLSVLFLVHSPQVITR